MGQQRNPDNDRHQATFRLPGDLLERLDHESERRVLGRSKLVEILLRDGLDRLPEAPKVASSTAAGSVTDEESSRPDPEAGEPQP